MNTMVIKKEFEMEVQCPFSTCKKRKTIKIPAYLFENKEMGVIKIQIHPGICCNHEFIAFVGKQKGNHPKIRGYENIDLALDLSIPKNIDQKSQIYLRELFIQYGDLVLSSCLHALILNIPIFFIKHNYGSSNSLELNTFFNRFIPTEFNNPSVEISYLSENNYRNAKIENALVVSPNGVVAHTPWPDISLIHEKEIFQKAFESRDDVNVSEIIQPEILKLLNKAQFFFEQLKNSEYFEEDMINMIANQFSEEISNEELHFLKQIVQFRLNGNIENLKIRSFSKLKEGLW
jgi:hypothetical protein